MVPILNPELWDGVLARLDAALCFGVNPNEFLLTIFEGAPLAVNSDDRAQHRLHAVDVAGKAEPVTRATRSGIAESAA